MNGVTFFFGVVIPYVALATFIFGVVYRVLLWARSPVPFRIPTSCGQQKSLSWIKSSELDNPHNNFWVMARMALEVLLFRSLFRNTKTERRDQKLVYGEDLWLWIAALAFHYTFLVIFIRHFRFFVEPVPFFVNWLQAVDGFMEIGVPTLFVSGLVALGAVTYLFLRRVYISHVRYISLPSDYFVLLLIMGIVSSGLLMRHFYKVDILSVKVMVTGLLSFNPVVPEGIGLIFYIHLLLVCALLMYFPFSKLTHMAGIFMSPTRNLANNSRARRHINPWNYPVKVHTYEEWEDEFRDLMKDAGMPLEKE